MQIHLLPYEKYEWNGITERAAVKLEDASFQTPAEIHQAVVRQEVELLKS